MNRFFIACILIIFCFNGIQALAGNPPSIRSFFVTSGDVKLLIRVAGKSKNVLIAINGGPGLSSEYMEALDELAGSHLEVVTYDQRGNGRSSAPKSEKDYSIGHYLQDLTAIQNALGVKKIKLFGHSFGGLVAMAYMAQYPDRVSKLALFGSAPPTAAQLNEVSKNRDAKVGKLIGEGSIHFPLPDPKADFAGFLNAITPAYFSNPHFPIPKELIRTKASLNIQILTLQDFGNYDLRNQLSGSKIPVLAMGGADDPFGPEMLKDVAAAFDDPSRSQVVTINSCGHFWKECNQTFLKLMHSFLVQK